MKIKSWIGYYVGSEFPEYYGEEIEIKDDNSDANCPCYSIKFEGENRWYNNMGDEDWQIMRPTVHME